MTPTQADLNLAESLWSREATQARDCICGAVDIDVSTMHAPTCGDPTPADVAALLATAREEDRTRIAYLEAALDAIARVADPGGGCLSTCATRRQDGGPDCDCGYMGACTIEVFVEAVAAGEENLDGAMKLWAAERGEEGE